MGALTVQPTAPERREFTREQIDLIKQTVAKGVSDLELQLLLYTAQRRGLDPLLKQVYGIVRDVNTKNADGSWSKQKQMTIQTGIDGFRLVASRTGQLAGIEDALIEESADKKNPVKATVTVYRAVQGVRCPFTATARWDEYKQIKYNGELMGLWAKMPYTMLSKCAEALALRKAFPEDLSGLYTFDEMAQADSETPKLVPNRKQLLKEAGEYEKQHQHILDKAEGKGDKRCTCPSYYDKGNYTGEFCPVHGTSVSGATSNATDNGGGSGTGKSPELETAAAPVEESQEVPSAEEAFEFENVVTAMKHVPKGLWLSFTGFDVAVDQQKWLDYIADKGIKTGWTVKATAVAVKTTAGEVWRLLAIYKAEPGATPLEQQLTDSVNKVKRSRPKAEEGV